MGAWSRVGWSTLALLLTCGVAALWSLAARPPLTCSGEGSRAIHQALESMAALAPAGQFALVTPGNTLQCNWGWARRPTAVQAGEAMTASHVLPYASLSKILTAMVTLEVLGAQGQDVHSAALSAGQASVASGAITFDHLLRHRSGLRYRGTDPVLHETELCVNGDKALSAYRFSGTPGDSFEYSNMGYCFLGMAAARLAGMPFPALLERTLGNQFRVYSRNTSGAQPPLADLYTRDEDVTWTYALDYQALLAAGGLAGTASELAWWLSEHYPDSALSQQNNALISAFPSGCDEKALRGCHLYGMYFYRPASGRGMLWRDGSLPGLSAVAVLSETAVAVVLINERPWRWRPHNEALAMLLYAILPQAERSPLN